jgi:hypothetical protein
MPRTSTPLRIQIDSLSPAAEGGAVSADSFTPPAHDFNEPRSSSTPVMHQGVMYHPKPPCYRYACPSPTRFRPRAPLCSAQPVLPSLRSTYWPLSPPSYRPPTSPLSSPPGYHYKESSESLPESPVLVDENNNGSSSYGPQFSFMSPLYSPPEEEEECDDDFGENVAQMANAMDPMGPAILFTPTQDLESIVGNLLDIDLIELSKYPSKTTATRQGKTTSTLGLLSKMQIENPTTLYSIATETVAAPMMVSRIPTISLETQQAAAFTTPIQQKKKRCSSPTSVTRENLTKRQRFSGRCVIDDSNKCRGHYPLLIGPFPEKMKSILRLLLYLDDSCPDRPLVFLAFYAVQNTEKYSDMKDALAAELGSDFDGIVRASNSFESPRLDALYVTNFSSPPPSKLHLATAIGVRTYRLNGGSVPEDVSIREAAQAVERISEQEQNAVWKLIVETPLVQPRARFERDDSRDDVEWEL